MNEILNYLGVGVGSIALLSVFIEIVPIKIYPIKWIGNHFNAGAMEKTEKLEKKLDQHIAESSRAKIFDFQNELLRNIDHTQEQFDQVIDACEEYEKFCEDNDVVNGKCKLAIRYIKNTYESCQANRSFLNLPVQKYD